MANTDRPGDVEANVQGGGFTASLAALKEAPRYKPGPPCGMRLILERIAADETDRALPEGSHAEVCAMVDDEAVSATALAEFLTEHGYQATPQKVARHRRRARHAGCRCPR